MEKPDVVVGTPSRILSHLQQDSLKLRDSLELLVMDEADLLFSFGFEEEVKSLLWYGGGMWGWNRLQGLELVGEVQLPVGGLRSWSLMGLCFVLVTCRGFVRLF